MPRRDDIRAWGHPQMQVGSRRAERIRDVFGSRQITVNRIDLKIDLRILERVPVLIRIVQRHTQFNRITGSRFFWVRIADKGFRSAGYSCGLKFDGTRCTERPCDGRVQPLIHCGRCRIIGPRAQCPGHGCLPAQVSDNRGIGFKGIRNTGNIA